MNSSFLKNFIEYLEAKDASFVVGTNLFGGQIPIEEANEKSSAVILRGGTPKRSILDGTVGNMRIQIYTRGVDYFDGQDRAILIGNYLDDTAGVSITPYYIHTIMANSEPGYLGQDERGRYEFSQNFDIFYSDPS